MTDGVLSLRDMLETCRGNHIHLYPQYSYGISNVLIIRYISCWLVKKFSVIVFGQESDYFNILVLRLFLTIT